MFVISYFALFALRAVGTTAGSEWSERDNRGQAPSFAIVRSCIEPSGLVKMMMPHAESRFSARIAMA